MGAVFIVFGNFRSFEVKIFKASLKIIINNNMNINYEEQ